MSETQLGLMGNFSSFALSHLRNEGDSPKDKITPVGAIQYAKGSKLVAIGENSDGILRAKYLDLNEQPLPGNVLIAANGRLQQLPNYDELMVAQISLDNVRVRTHRSIRTLPSVNVGLDYTNSSTGEAETLNLDEVDILKVFTGEQGGLLVFDGVNLPEENALVIEKQAQLQRIGLVFFFHPQEATGYGIDSVTGLFTFVQMLNQEFIDKAPLDLQTQILKTIEKLTELDGLNSETQERAELFKTIAIAHARLAKRSSISHYHDFMEKFLRVQPVPGLRNQVKAWRGKPQEVYFMQPDADSFIDRCIIGSKNRKDGASQAVLAAPEQNPGEMKDKAYGELRKTLQSQKALVLRTLMQESGGLGEDDKVNRQYLEQIAADLIKNKDSDQIARLEDAVKLLNEMEKTKFASSLMGYELHWTYEHIIRYLSIEGEGRLYTTTGKNLILELKQKIVELRSGIL